MSFSIFRANGDEYAFDAAIGFGQSRDAVVTDHPVEEGADPSDNSVAKGLAWVVRGVVAEGSGNEVSPNEMHFVLDGMVLNGEILTILHPRIGSFVSVTLENYSFEVTPLKSLLFAMRFKEIRRATSQSVTFQPRLGAADLAKAEDSAKQGTTDADEETDERAKSLAASLFDWTIGR